ncbi:hypothetical protein M0R45_007498 [Rubus argutus]|uniref:Uncharacterized protein n=1 Tax=Rubus argutus TaxID=59490 RepID=A0AAW1Y0U9_RUBAR
MAAHCITTISHGLLKPRLTLSGLSIAAGKSHFTAAATTPDHHHSAIHELLCSNQSTPVLCTHLTLITSTTTSIAAAADTPISRASLIRHHLQSTEPPHPSLGIVPAISSSQSFTATQAQPPS